MKRSSHNVNVITTTASTMGHASTGDSADTVTSDASATLTFTQQSCFHQLRGEGSAVCRTEQEPPQASLEKLMKIVMFLRIIGFFVNWLGESSICDSKTVRGHTSTKFYVVVL